MKPIVETKFILLYDGLCGFCNRLVGFVLNRDHKKIFYFAPLDGDFADDLFDRHPNLKVLDSLIFVENSGLEDEVVWLRSEAVRRIFGNLGGIWRIVGSMLSIFPKSFQDSGYDVFARNRYRWFGHYDTCKFPDSFSQDQFLK